MDAFPPDVAELVSTRRHPQEVRPRSAAPGRAQRCSWVATASASVTDARNLAAAAALHLAPSNNAPRPLPTPGPARRAPIPPLRQTADEWLDKLVELGVGGQDLLDEYAKVKALKDTRPAIAVCHMW